MYGKRLLLLAIGAGHLMLPCSAQSSKTLIDPRATNETKALFRNLDKLAGKHILFGHQHATEYGHGWSGEVDRSDVKSVTGSHPAVIGVDLGGLTSSPDSVYQQVLKQLQQNITDTYDRGGVTTVAWHFSNPGSPGGFYWKDSISAPAVGWLIPGGKLHRQYKDILTRVSQLFQMIRGKDGKLVPVIFRPYHEQDGDWFWWGKSHCTINEFKSLWRFTVAYLRDSLRVHNLIYAFSPDCTFRSEEEYLERYPGNEWVDMLGMDDYADFGRDGKYNVDEGIRKLRIVSAYAERSGKLAAFTETGLESIPNPSWWTSVLLPALRAPGLRLCYVLVWRNDTRSPTHYYAPFPGQSSVPDFLRFFRDPFTFFEDDLQQIYR